MTEITWNLRALTDDATAWSCVANHLVQANALLGQASPSQGDFMSFLGHSGAASTATAQAVGRLQAFLADGSTRVRLGSAVLLEVRDAYQANEDEARATYDGMWEPDDD